MASVLKLGISSCLLGNRVRYDGRHKLDRFLTHTSGRHVRYVPVCPEVECGLPVPREPMRLEGSPATPRLMTHHSRRDLTGQMLRWTTKRLKSLERQNLCGFIFKSKSPSCGMKRVPVCRSGGRIIGRSPGIFAREFAKQFPLLPVEDEVRLQDSDLWENFIERILTLRRYRQAIRREKVAKAVAEFHACHRLLIMSHSETLCRRMERLVSDIGKRKPQGVVAEYQAMLLKSLQLPATPQKHAKVLRRIMQHFERQLSAGEKKKLLRSVEAFRLGRPPRVVPLRLLACHAHRCRVEHLRNQVYLHPHPLEFQLRARV